MKLFLGIFLLLLSFSSLAIDVDSHKGFNVVIYEGSEEAVGKFCATFMDDPNGKYHGCMWLNIEKNTCYLVVPKFNSQDRFVHEVWGHELSHCVYGNWHGEVM